MEKVLHRRKEYIVRVTLHHQCLSTYTKTLIFTHNCRIFGTETYMNIIQGSFPDHDSDNLATRLQVGFVNAPVLKVVAERQGAHFVLHLTGYRDSFCFKVSQDKVWE